MTVAMTGPAVGAKGKLYKFFEADVPILGHTTGWLEIGEVTVSKIGKDEVTLTIDKEKSQVVMNGKKVEGFQKGAKVKLVLEP